jgi:hypothetical protein
MPKSIIKHQPSTATSLPQGWIRSMNAASEWQVYRTRFLIRARQLTEPMVFVDALGREHCGCAGDYLVESSDGTRRIAPREIFEDVYVPMGPADENWPALARRKPPEDLRRAPTSPLN